MWQDMKLLVVSTGMIRLLWFCKAWASFMSPWQRVWSGWRHSLLFLKLFLIRSIKRTLVGFGELVGPESGLFLQQFENILPDPHGHNSSSWIKSWSFGSSNCFIELYIIFASLLNSEMILNNPFFNFLLPLNHRIFFWLYSWAYETF